MSVEGVGNVGGGSSEKNGKRSFLTIGIGGMTRLTAFCRVLTVGKKGDVCRAWVGTRIFIMFLVFMACEAWVSFKMGLARGGGIMGSRFTIGGGLREACNGTGGCDRFVRVGDIGGGGTVCMVARDCMGVAGVRSV